MIGQTKLLETVTDQINRGVYPRFSILIGGKGSGRKLMAQTISQLLKGVPIMTGTKVDDIRDMIDSSYRLSTNTTVYIIPDADTMSEAAKNALLKVTEEPPNNSYFIMTLENENNTLPTIRSRGTVFCMDNYTPSEIQKFCDTWGDGSQKKIGIVVELCETPLEVQQLYQYDPIEFKEYTDKVIDNIATVSGSHSFKIANKISLSNEEDKYDLRLFWKSFMTGCMTRLGNDPFKYSAGVKLTSNYLGQLRNNTINKQFLFDMWLLDIRSNWLNLEG